LGNANVLVPPFTAIKLLLRIFYSLNCIDLPEFFEDHMNDYMTVFRKFLVMELNYEPLVGDEVTNLINMIEFVRKTRSQDYYTRFKLQFVRT
jgi:hypothetical protein